MSLINQALKKAQKTPSTEEKSSPKREARRNTLSPIPTAFAGMPSSKTRWYLVVALAVPALILPVLSLKWSHEKKVFQSEIEFLTHSPLSKQKTHGFMETEKSTSQKTVSQRDSSTNGLASAKKSTQTISLSTARTNQGSRHTGNSNTQTIAKNNRGEVQRFVSASRVTGVRRAGDNSKVVINNKAYPVDAVVDDNLNIKIKRIDEKEIVFLDEDGIEYSKPL